MLPIGDYVIVGGYGFRYNHGSTDMAGKRPNALPTGYLTLSFHKFP